MITRQPQPASYWIDLLDELTDGWFSEATKGHLLDNVTTSKLSEFIDESFDWFATDLNFDFWARFMWDACYIESGQSVIDAAVKYEDTPFLKAIPLKESISYQVQLYKRCNGIKN